LIIIIIIIINNTTGQFLHSTQHKTIHNKRVQLMTPTDDQLAVVPCNSTFFFLGFLASERARSLIITVQELYILFMQYITCTRRDRLASFFSIH